MCNSIESSWTIIWNTSWCIYRLGNGFGVSSPQRIAHVTTRKGIGGAAANPSPLLLDQTSKTNNSDNAPESNKNASKTIINISESDDMELEQSTDINNCVI